MGAYLYFYHLQPTTYHLCFLVAERVHRLAVAVQELHDLVLGAPQGARAIQVDAPGIAREVGVIPVCLHAAVVVQIVHDETLAGA